MSAQHVRLTMLSLTLILAVAITNLLKAPPVLAISGTTTRVSVATGGGEANGFSFAPAISADGRYVAFQSSADNLVINDTNNVNDIFVYDRQAGTTERVSVATGGTESNDSSSDPAISADGRYVAFVSGATNLVGSDTNGANDIFVHDRQAGTTERVSVASNGDEADSFSFNPAISADGRYVVFGSSATNLFSGDTNAVPDIFVHDRQTEMTERVSVATGGGEANGPSYAPVISSNGRYVAFVSEADNLVSGDTNGQTDIFVHDRQQDTTERVSLTNDGAQADGPSFFSSISADGRYVAFESSASNLVSGDTNGLQDIFVRDRQLETTVRVSVATGGTEATGPSFTPVIAADGRFVAFQSGASNLISGDMNGANDIFVHDRQEGTTERVSVASDGTEANSDSGAPAISADGLVVAFDSFASNLVIGDTNTASDIFVFATQTYSISGQVVDGDGNGVAGVTISDGTRTATTDANGDYTLSNVPAGSYTLTPSRAGCTFTPVSSAVTVPPDATAQNFTASCTTPPPPTYSISGQVVDGDGNGVAGVTISDGTRSATTDANGDYTLSNVPAGSYTLTPSRSGYSFNPPVRTISVNANVTGQDFTATPDAVSGSMVYLPLIVR